MIKSVRRDNHSSIKPSTTQCSLVKIYVSNYTCISIRIKLYGYRKIFKHICLNKLPTKKYMPE